MTGEDPDDSAKEKALSAEGEGSPSCDVRLTGTFYFTAVFATQHDLTADQLCREFAEMQISKVRRT